MHQKYRYDLEIVSLGKSVGLDMEGVDINELAVELIVEELKGLQAQQHTEVLPEMFDAEEVEEVISTSEIKEILEVWDKLSEGTSRKSYNWACDGAI